MKDDWDEQEDRLKINENDTDLAARINIFKDECKRINALEEAKRRNGFYYKFSWYQEIGFNFRFLLYATIPVFTDEEMKTQTIDECCDALKRQIAILEEGKKTLAGLIRLKNELKLPGPVTQRVFDKNILDLRYRELPDNEIEDILKH